MNNLLEIYEKATQRSALRLIAGFSGKATGSSAEVAEVVIEGLGPIRERYSQLISDPAELDRLIAQGAEQACAVPARSSKK